MSTVNEALGSIPSTPELDVLVHAVVLALGRQRHSIRSSRSSVVMQPVRGQPGLRETLSQTSTPKPRTSNTNPLLLLDNLGKWSKYAIGPRPAWSGLYPLVTLS